MHLSVQKQITNQLPAKGCFGERGLTNYDSYSLHYSYYYSYYKPILFVLYTMTYQFIKNYKPLLGGNVLMHAHSEQKLSRKLAFSFPKVTKPVCKYFWYLLMEQPKLRATSTFFRCKCKKNFKMMRAEVGNS